VPPPNPSPQRASSQTVLLLPKLRRHFAEFLDHSSPDRLGILYLTTCVGLGYGPQQHSLEAFLDSMGSPYFASIGYASPLTLQRPPDLPRDRATGLHQDNQRLAELPSCVTPSLAYYQLGIPRSPNKPPRRRVTGFGWLASPASTLDAPSRAREYQPVIHRLRLSASP
jgi:hypothetical protein